MVDEEAIRHEVYSQRFEVVVHESRFTPSGNPRKVPMYEGTIENGFLNESKVVKGKSTYEVEAKAEKQLRTWAEREVRCRIAEAKEKCQGQRG